MAIEKTKENKYWPTCRIYITSGSIAFILSIGYLWIYSSTDKLQYSVTNNLHYSASGKLQWLFTQQIPKNGSQALICYNRGSWVNNHSYTPESQEHNCTRMLHEFVKATRPKRWLFLGDSILTLLFAQITRLHSTWNRTAMSHDRMKFMNIPRSSNWIPPTHLEGPIRPDTRPFDSECRRCDSRRYKCENNIELELLAIEFARDVELQSPTTRTTQQTLGIYLRRDPFDICVVNNGMHDYQLKQLTDAQYLLNVKWYLRILKSACPQILWLSLSHVLGDIKYEQRNDRILLWNRSIAKMLQRKSRDYAYVDWFPISNRSDLHHNNLHHIPWFYRYIAKTLFIKPIFEPSFS